MTSSTFSRAASTSAIQESPGISDDFEVQQLRTRSSKRRRTSGGQNMDDQMEPNTALSCIRNLVMENIRDRVAFNWITEEFCQMEKLHMIEVASVANRAYSKVLKDFPDLLTGGSVTVALVDTLAKAHDKHTLAILEEIEQSHQNWVQLKKDRSDAEAELLANNGQLFDHLLSEAVNPPPAAFNNVLNLSVGLLLPIQHTMPPIQPTIVLTTQAPTLGVIPPMGINLSVTGSTGDGGNDGDGRDQQADDNPPEDGGASGTEPEEGQEVDDPDNQNDDDDVILVSSPSCKAAKHSGTPLSTSGRDVGLDSSVRGITGEGLAISPARMNLRDGTYSQLLSNPDTKAH